MEHETGVYSDGKSAQKRQHRSCRAPFLDEEKTARAQQFARTIAAQV